VWDPTRFPNTARNKSVRHVRHAVALDERRRYFNTNLWLDGPTRGGSVQQMWFAGCHGDVGGGVDDDPHNALWWPPFAWMVREAVGFGLAIDRRAWLKLLRRRQRRTGHPDLKAPRPVSWPTWRHPINESLEGWWWVTEFRPRARKQKRPITNRLVRWMRSIPWGKKIESGEVNRLTYDRHRVVPDGALIHRSVLRRLRATELNYTPKNLDPEFVKRVRAESRIEDSSWSHETK
jgi:uncharacterized protein (DUF2235 family)